MIPCDICLWLASLSVIVSVSIRVTAAALFRRECYLRLRDVSIVYLYHAFFIRSSGDGHVDCFHVLANANSEHRGACVFPSYSFPRHTPRRGLLDNMAALLLVF